MKEKIRLTLEKLEDRVLLDGDYGLLQIDNVLSSEEDSNEAFLKYTSDGLPDDPWLSVPAGSNISLEDSFLNLWAGQSEMPGYSPFNTNLTYEGNIPTSPITTNWLEIKFPYAEPWQFGTLPITLQEDNGQRNDVRRAIENGEGGVSVGIIPLEDIPAGDYTSSTPYATPKVHFNKTADLNNDGNVDPVDLVLLGENWLNYEGMPGASGKYLLGDITGDNGLPDGRVDMYDFVEMSKQWGN